MKSDLDPDGAAAVFGVAMAAVMGAAYLAFGFGSVLTAPPAKSERELCEERGGVYVDMYHRQNRCFSKESFK